MSEIPEQVTSCRWFRWIGQPWTSCDGCGRPAWEHDGELVAGDGQRPWGEGEADRMRERFGSPAGPEPATSPQTAPESTETGQPVCSLEVGSADDGIFLETPTALRDRIADRLLDKDCNSWGYGMLEGSRNSALAVADVMLAVRNDELERLRREMATAESVIRNVKALMQRRTETLCARAERAESAVDRVRELHSEIPYKPGYCYCSNPFPCPTIRALDQPADQEDARNG